MKILYLGACILIIFMTGCNSYNYKIASYIDENCPGVQQGDSCLIYLKNVTDFEWDHMYEFKDGFNPEDISEIIGFDCHCDEVPDNYRKIIFTKNDEIVKEDDYYGLESPIQIGESYKNTLAFSKYTPQTAVFRVKRGKKLSGAYFYNLFPLYKDSLQLSQ